MGVFITQKGSSIQPSLQMGIARKVQRTQCTDRVLLPRHYRQGLHCTLHLCRSRTRAWLDIHCWVVLDGAIPYPSREGVFVWANLAKRNVPLEEPPSLLAIICRSPAALYLDEAICS